VPKPPDWNESSVVTGYWFLDDKGWVMPPSLRGFLDASSPPVYVGFGSIPSTDPVRTTAMVVEALAIAGQRGILASGWGGLTAGFMSDRIYMLDVVPHDRMFPYVAAVVHHGGAGTTAAGLRAGKPTVICPFFGDQPFWGRQVARLGAGPAPVLHKDLTASRLAQAILVAVEDVGVRTRAAQLGERIRAEDGVGRAVAFIMDHPTMRTDNPRRGS
jgi:sterol 3beta-glucosyltransferase